MDGKINFWKNDTKGNVKAPLFKGFITIEGVVHEFAAWAAKNGKPDVYSGTYKPKDEKWVRSNSTPAVSKPTFEQQLDDEIPF